MFWSMLNAPTPEGESVRLAGEPRIAAEATFIKACDQLQVILDEKPRWDFAFQLDMENDYREAIKLNREYLVAQRAHAIEMSSPHFRMQPAIHKLTNGQWMAILGSIDNIDNAVIGLGDCPQEALEAFDKMFAGEVPESVAKFINENTYDTNEQIEQVDGSTNQPTQNPPSRGEDSQGDIPHNG